jgi:hypothetical protein
MSPTTLRPIAAAAALGGLCWIVFACHAVAAAPPDAGTRVVLDTAAEWFGFSLFAVCLALAVPGILALHLHQRGADGRLGRVGAIVAMTGAAAQCVVISGIVAAGEETSWFGIGAPLAILTWFAGSILFGIATRRAGVLPGWIGIALPIATLFAIVGADYGTSVLLGTLQLFIGVRILRATGDAASRPGVQSAGARA